MSDSQQMLDDMDAVRAELRDAQVRLRLLGHLVPVEASEAIANDAAAHGLCIVLLSADTIEAWNRRKTTYDARWANP